MSTPTQDPHAVLGIPRDADDQQVRDAYRRLAKRYHPDRDAGPQANESMRRVNQAWDALSDPTRRAARAATATGAERRTSARGSSTWTFRPAHEPRHRIDDASTAGAPFLLLAVVLLVAWLLVGGPLGLFLLPGLLGLAAVGVARFVLDGS